MNYDYECKEGSEDFIELLDVFRKKLNSADSQAKTEFIEAQRDVIAAALSKLEAAA